MVLRALLALGLLLVATTGAMAHRPGESYVYLDVTDDGITGEFHIRVADIAQALPLDANGDGTVSDDEVTAREAEIGTYLSERLTFFANGSRHAIDPGDLRFFAKPKVRQMALAFDLPTLRPVPDVLEVDYRFLYDGADPDHRPMLLLESNTRMRLVENEWFVSLVFGPGAERQSVSLVPPPTGPLLVDFALKGVYMMLAEPGRLVLAAALLLPLAAVRRPGAWVSPAGIGEVVRGVGTTALVFAAGMAVVLLIRTRFDLRPSPPYDDVLLALSLLVIALDNVWPLRRVRRWHVVLLAGLLQGAGRNDYTALVGVYKGMPEIVLTGFALGVALALIVLAAILVPILILVRDLKLYRLSALRLGSVLLVGAGAALFAAKVAV